MATSLASPIYRCAPNALDWWHRGLYVSMAASVVILPVISAESLASSTFVLVIVLINAAWMWLGSHRGYEIWPDRVEILHARWKSTIPMSTVLGVRSASLTEAFFFHRPWHTTSVENALIIERGRGMFSYVRNRILSPADPDQFTYHLMASLENAGRESS